MIGDHTNPTNSLGIAQYLNCAMWSSGSRNNCKLVRVTINIEKVCGKNHSPGCKSWPAIIRTIRKRPNYSEAVSLSVLPALANTCDSSKCGETCHTTRQYTNSVSHSRFEIMPYTTVIVPKHYGYSTDSLWKITMRMEVARGIRRNLVRHPRKNFSVAYKIV